MSKHPRITFIKYFKQEEHSLSEKNFIANSKQCIMT